MPGKHEGSESEDDAVRFIGLFTANEGRLRAFLFNLLPGRESVDEVMQNVSMALWKKFHQLENDDGFLRWAYVVARFEVLMYRRRAARDRFVFDEALIEQLSTEYEKESAMDDAIQESLATCLSKLDDSDRQLVIAAYRNRVRIVSLAEKLNLTANRIYKILARIRRRLQACIERELRSST